MCKHASCDTDCNSLRWDGFKDVCMEYGRDDFNDQHEHGGDLLRNSDGCQGMHRLRFWHSDGQSQPHSLS